MLAVTHLPQVAACADHHSSSPSAARKGITTSDITAVGGEQRVAEVARMLGGERLTTSLAHAKELLTMAGARK